MKTYYDAFLDEVRDELPYLTMQELLRRYTDWLGKQVKILWNPSNSVEPMCGRPSGM